MSEQIKRGDLVVVVRDCCGHWLGHTFTVGRSKVSASYCEYCSADFDSQLWHQRAGTKCGYAASWLKRIPPLPEEQDVEHEEEIHA